MSNNEVTPPKVFISYSHDSQEHADNVLELSDRLREDEIDCILDQYEDSLPEGWPRWMDRQIREADFVLMICTPTYYRRVMGKEQPGIGLGVRWEGNLIYQHFYNEGTLNTKFIPVLLNGASISDIPTPYQGAIYYRPTTEAGYEQLYRRLTNQPLIPKPALGNRRQLPPRERKHDFFGNMLDKHKHDITENIPYEQNRFFTGREDILDDLHETLTRESVVALTQIQAISGLGGVGKTQTALEYSYRYRTEYNAIFWIRAEKEVEIRSGYVEIAKLLGLPEQNAHDPDNTIYAVRKWLENSMNWLLIFDNADTPELLKAFLPHKSKGKGHILLTSRAQIFDALGISKPIEMKEMLLTEAVTFLFKRAGREDRDSEEKKAAEQLADELGYLPLALEQSGAYITEKKARFQDYLASYRSHHLRTLNKSLPKAGDYPASIATTWEINFREVEKVSSAAELLHVSAFLSSDSIPLELIISGASQLGSVLSDVLATADTDPLVLNETLEPLTRFSLIRRDVDANTYSIHRLVQDVVKDTMDVSTRRAWAERAVRATSIAFPEVKPTTWYRCQRCLQQAQACKVLIDQFEMTFMEAVKLLEKAGLYLHKRGQYTDAEPFYQRALAIQEKILGSEHPSVVSNLTGLGWLYHDAGKYEQAEPLLTRALTIQEKTFGLEHPSVAYDLNSLGELYIHLKKYSQAELLLNKSANNPRKI